jgi:hypothetical protein
MQSGTPDSRLTCREDDGEAGDALLADLTRSSRGDWI